MTKLVARLLDRWVLWSLYAGIRLSHRFGAPVDPEFEARIVVEWRRRPRLLRRT